MFKPPPATLANKLYESLCLKARNGLKKKLSGDDKIEKNLKTRLLCKVFMKEVSSTILSVILKIIPLLPRNKYGLIFSILPSSICLYMPSPSRVRKYMPICKVLAADLHFGPGSKR